jgi:hypothetical protein
MACISILATETRAKFARIGRDLPSSISAGIPERSGNDQRWSRRSDDGVQFHPGVDKCRVTMHG